MPAVNVPPRFRLEGHKPSFPNEKNICLAVPLARNGVSRQPGASPRKELCCEDTLRVPKVQELEGCKKQRQGDNGGKVGDR